MLLALSAIGLILGMYGCFLTIRKSLINSYNTQELFNLWEENQKFFRWIDYLTLIIGRKVFRKYENRYSKLTPQEKTIREATTVVFGFIFILIGFLFQFIAVIIILLRQC